MKHEEIKKGQNITKGHCTGQAVLTCAPVCAQVNICDSVCDEVEVSTCDKPSNLAECQGPTSLKTTKANTPPGSKCCGGGTLTSPAAQVYGVPCGAQTSLCDKDGEVLQHGSPK